MRSECCSGPVNLHQQPGIAEWCPTRRDCMSTTRSAYVVPADGVQPPVSHHLITRATHGTMAGDTCDTHRDWGAVITHPWPVAAMHRCSNPFSASAMAAVYTATRVHHWNRRLVSGSTWSGCRVAAARRSQRRIARSQCDTCPPTYQLARTSPRSHRRATSAPDTAHRLHHALVGGIDGVGKQRVVGADMPCGMPGERQQHLGIGGIGCDAEIIAPQLEHLAEQRRPGTGPDGGTCQIQTYSTP
jgi:hypothetical protein